VEAQEFNRGMLEELFSIAGEMERVVWEGGSKLLDGKIMASLFYEESTRTRFSFETAMHRLGGSVISTENARQFSSVSKGETLEDTIRIMNGYADVIVMRHYESGAARRAADVSRVPIINAGDGTGQHPTQAFLDLYTIQKELGRLDDLDIAVVGDLANGRTVRSLCYLLAKYRNVRIHLVAPEVVRMRLDIKEYLGRHDVWFQEENNLRAIIGEVDVVYQTRIQKERFGDREDDYRAAQGVYVIDREHGGTDETRIDRDAPVAAGRRNNGGCGLRSTRRLLPPGPEWVVHPNGIIGGMPRQGPSSGNERGPAFR